MIEKIAIKIGVGIAALIAAAVGYDIHENRKVAKKIDMSCKNLKEASIKDIQQGIVEQAVKNAAVDSVQNYMDRVRSDVMADARMKLTDEARKAVKDASDTIQREVGDRISTEASMIDMAALKKSARDKAEEKILDKFDGNLEDLLSRFNDNLSNVQKIYGGIADAISKSNDRDKGLKLTLG